MRLLKFVLLSALIHALVILALIIPVHADVLSTSGAGMGLQVHIGKLDLMVPLNEIDVTYLYDVIGKRNLVGGETPVAKIWKIEGTLGAITSVDGQGAPYVGGKLQIPNPVPNWAFLGEVQPGLFGGYDWRRGAAIAGFKADIPLFQ